MLQNVSAVAKKPTTNGTTPVRQGLLYRSAQTIRILVSDALQSGMSPLQIQGLSGGGAQTLECFPYGHQSGKFPKLRLSRGSLFS